MSEQVSFNGGGVSAGGILGAVKDSAINVGATAVAGGVIGAAGGKLVSLKPYTPNSTAMEAQYRDMFLRAGNASSAGEVPEYLKDKGDDVLNLVKKSGRILKRNSELTERANEIATMGQAVSRADNATFSGNKFQSLIAEFFKDKPEKIPEGGYTKEGVVERLQTSLGKIDKISKRLGEKYAPLSDEFVEKAAKNEEIKEIAEKGAKHLRKRSIIGAGIAIGVCAALVLNLLRTYGVIGRKKSSSAGSNGGAAQTQYNPAQIQNTATLKTTQG